MSLAATLSPTSQIALSPQHLGICQSSRSSPSGALEAANKLLKRNHEEHHIFFRDISGHNHIAHHLLTILALGAGPSELNQAFEGNTSYQRPVPQAEEQIIQALVDDEEFLNRMGAAKEYGNFLAFFKQKMDQQDWRSVVNEYCFSNTPVANAMLAHLFEGAYHPVIHLGLGIEFDQPSVIAEALAQAAAHPKAGLHEFFLEAEQLAKSESAPPSLPLVDLIHAVRGNEAVRKAPHWEEDACHKVSDGIIGRARKDFIPYAAQFRIAPEDLERSTAEMMSCAAYIAGAGHRLGKAIKIDFFYMHAVTSSIFLDVLMNQSWISREVKVRTMEWKGRIDLLWYAACGSPELHIEEVQNYKGQPSADKDWEALFDASNKQRDDGHVAKFVRALKHGQEVARPFENGKWAACFPVHGDMWLKVARMGFDTAIDEQPQLKKWILYTGFDQAWASIPARP